MFRRKVRLQQISQTYIQIMQTIKNLRAMEILDSRGNPTMKVFCELKDGTTASASVPSGASTGLHEALELRDGNPKRYNGLGVSKAVKNVNEEIMKELVGKEFDQKSLDQTLIKLDGTENKSRLGGNAILGVSLAFARATALSKKIELYEYLGELAENNDFKIPTPMLNVINGGMHADSGLDIQEFMLIPVGFDSFRKKIEVGAETIHALKTLLKEKGYAVSVGDEGGFAPKLSTNEEALDLMEASIKKAGYSPKEIKLGMDVAASSFYENKKERYILKMNGKETEATATELVNWYEKISTEHPIISIEDGLAEDDWAGFIEMEKQLGEKIKIIGDDLTVTNSIRIQMASEKKAINGVIIKPNQIGTLTETIEAVKIAKESNLAIVVSHRSGDTEDTFISDLAVGVSADYIKSGSLIRSERTSKYNRLLEIEEKILFPR